MEELGDKISMQLGSVADGLVCYHVRQGNEKQAGNWSHIQVVSDSASQRLPRQISKDDSSRLRFLLLLTHRSNPATQNDRGHLSKKNANTDDRLGRGMRLRLVPRSERIAM